MNEMTRDSRERFRLFLVQDTYTRQRMEQPPPHSITQLGMSSTSLGTPYPADTHPPNGHLSNSGREKSISLRSATVTDASSGKTAGVERVWRSGQVVPSENKLIGEEGAKVVVAAW